MRPRFVAANYASSVFQLIVASKPCMIGDGMIKEDDTGRKYSAILVDGIQKAPARSMLRAVGFDDADFKRPQVGIASTEIGRASCRERV